MDENLELHARVKDLKSTKIKICFCTRISPMFILHVGIKNENLIQFLFIDIFELFFKVIVQ